MVGDGGRSARGDCEKLGVDGDAAAADAVLLDAGVFFCLPDIFNCI